MVQQIPAVDYLVLGDGDTIRPHLQAWVCSSCSASYFDRRNACARCFGTEFARAPLGTEGIIRAFTRVERGTKIPFTSVVVDLGGAVTVKANLRGVDDPAQITAEMKVRMYTYVAGVDDDGVEAVAFAFEPVSDASERGTSEEYERTMNTVGS
ncbi:MAG: Zn-ribbon domain-containing OB-fold protein [Sporichthyaceae bacterium]